MADAAARLHVLTRHGALVDRSQLVAFSPLDPANRPAPFKRYPDRPIVALPTDPGARGRPRRPCWRGGCVAAPGCWTPGCSPGCCSWPPA